MAAYHRVYDSRHLQADCQEPGSTPEPYARSRVWATFTFTLVLYCLSEWQINFVANMTACRILEAGVKCLSVGLGSTPTASQPSALMTEITELHPGNYVFYGQTP